MKELIRDLEALVQEVSLRNIEQIDRAPLYRLRDEMHVAISDMPKGVDRLLLKAFVSKLEDILNGT